MLTQADVARAIRAAKQAGAEAVEVRPDGTIIVLLKGAPLVVAAPEDPSRNGNASMNRRKLPGVASATKRLADGTRQRYYYAWHGGPLLKAEDGTPLELNNPDFHVAYAKAHAERKKPAAGMLFSLIAAFRASSEFDKIAEKTKGGYRRYLKRIEEEFGTMPLAAVQDVRARGKFRAWRDTMADRPRAVDYAWSVLLRVLSFAKDRGTITVNVCERGGRLYEADRAEIIWTAVDCTPKVRHGKLGTVLHRRTDVQAQIEVQIVPPCLQP